MLAQTKNCIEALLTAGFTRKEIRVRTKCINGYYQNPTVCIWNRQKAIDLTPKIIEQGLAVVHYIKDGKVAVVNVEYGEPAKLYKVEI